MTMSWVADAVATMTAASATNQGADSGSWRPRKDDRHHQQDLREHQPAAPVAEQAAEDRHLKGIDDGRPQELDGVGNADQGEQADRAEIDADILHPQQ